MALYIKDSAVDELAEQVRVQLGVKTKTDAVKAALQHELQRPVKEKPLRERIAEVQELAAELLSPSPDHIDMKKLMDDLWEEGA